MKQALASAVLAFACWVPLAHAASVEELPLLKQYLFNQDPISSTNNSYSIEFTTETSGPYKFEIKDLGPIDLGAPAINVGDLQALGLVVSDGGGVVGTASLVHPTNTVDSFIANLEAHKQYAGSLFGVAGDGPLGLGSLSISAVPLPAPVALLASAIGGLLLVRRRQRSKAS